jgi:hypothetical protein
MGLFDKLKDSTKATMAQFSNSDEAVHAIKEQIVFELPIKFIAGKHLVNGSNSFLGDKMIQLKDDSVIFNLTDPVFFTIKDIEFAGAKFHEEISQDTKAEAKGTKNTKKKNHGVRGAVIGTLLAPGVGTLAGAMIGSHKGKSKEQSESSATSSSLQKTLEVEDPSTTTVTLIKNSNGEEISIVLETKTVDYQKLTSFHYNHAAAETETPVDEASAIDQVLKLKQLLDAGVLTQEEFDAKKKQLLNL